MNQIRLRCIPTKCLIKWNKCLDVWFYILVNTMTKSSSHMSPARYMGAAKMIALFAEDIIPSLQCGFHTESYHQTIGPSPQWVSMTLDFYSLKLLRAHFWRILFRRIFLMDCPPCEKCCSSVGQNPTTTYLPECPFGDAAIQAISGAPAWEMILIVVKKTLTGFLIK